GRRRLVTFPRGIRFPGAPMSRFVAPKKERPRVCVARPSPVEASHLSQAYSRRRIRASVRGAGEAPMSIRDEALGLYRRGWSVVPMRMETKVPAVKWKALQSSRATERQLATWWKPGSAWGLGVIFGPISGDLASRDFDDMEAYREW